MDTIKAYLFATLIGFALLGALGCGGGTGVGGTYGSAETLTFEGWDSYRKQDLPKGEELFNSALALDPTYTEAYNGLGWLNFRKAGQEEDKDRRLAALNGARKNFEHAVNADPGNTDALVGLAGVDLALGEWEKASIAAGRALDLSPRYFSSHDNIDYRDVHLVMAEAYFFMGRFKHTTETPDPNNALYHIDVVDPGYKAFYESNQLTPPDLVRRIEELQTPRIQAQ